jgi:hypothetical protein
MIYVAGKFAREVDLHDKSTSLELLTVIVLHHNLVHNYQD